MGSYDTSLITQKTQSVPIKENGEIWVFWQFLEDYTIPFRTINNGTSRYRKSGGQSWVNKSYTADNRKNIILYDSIPNRTTDKYHLPPVEVLVQYLKELEYQKQQQEKELKRLDNERLKLKDIERLNELHHLQYNQGDKDYYRIHASKLGEEKIAQMARSCAMLRVLCMYKAKHDVRLAFNTLTSNAQLRELVAQQIASEVQHSKTAFYGMRITNPLRLHRKMKEWEKAITEDEKRGILITKKLSNDNARKGEMVQTVGMDDHEIIWMGIWLNFGKSSKYTKERTYQIYEACCESRKLKPKAIRTMGAFLNKGYIKMASAYERDGKKVFNDRYLPYISALRSGYSLSIVSLDGGVVGLYYQRPDHNGRNIVRKRLTLVFLTDHHSGAIIGFDIGETEKGDMARKALRMMFKMTDYTKAKEVILDNGSAFNNYLTKQSLEVCFERVSPIKPSNSQANPAEGMVRILEQRFSEYEGWSGENITSKGRLRPNPDYFPKPSELMTKQEVIREVIEVIETYNSELLDDDRTRWETFKQDINPTCQQLDELSAQFINRLRSKPIKIERGELVHTVDDKTRIYVVDNWFEASRQLDDKNKGKVVVYYDDDCPEYVEVYNYKSKDDASGDSFLFVMNEKEYTAKGFAEQTDETKKALGKGLKRKNDTKESVEQTLENIQEMFENEFDEGELSVPFTTGRNRHKKHLHNAEDHALSEYYFEQTSEPIPDKKPDAKEMESIEEIREKRRKREYEMFLQELNKEQRF